MKGIELKSDAEIKLLVIKKYDKEFKADGKSEAYLDARFDVAMETKVEKKENSAINEQRKIVNGKQNNDSIKSVESSRNDYIKNLTNEWKKSEAVNA
ncbi:MAG: hypothetical protein HC773_19520 [Scytonema sp. CRU_2_7]|nr:hypothetical protein [Scytonema sp. CRU_2_7]